MPVRQAVVTYLTKLTLMPQKVLYLQGFGAGEEGLSRALADALGPSYQVLTPSFDWLKPVETAKALDAVYRAHADDAPVIVGIALGGFFANYLAREFGSPALLVNPILVPGKALGEFGAVLEILDSYRQLEALEAQQTTLPLRRIVLGMQDRIVNHAENGLRLRDDARLVFLNMGHRVEPEYVATVASLVRELAGSPVEPMFSQEDYLELKLAACSAPMRTVASLERA